MQRWFRSLPSSLLMQSERTHIEKRLTHILGEYLLQIGGPSEFSLLSPAKNKIYLAHQPNPENLIEEQKAIAAEYLYLPLYPEKINIILIIHILEFLDQPKPMLKQIYDALAPCGQLIIVGFNPLSLWGLTHLWKKSADKPWHGHFYSIWQVKHWLRQVGFRIIHSETFHFRPPIENQTWDKRLLWLEAAGQLCLPNLGSVFIISAQKRDEGMTPILVNAWKTPLILNNNYAKQASQIISAEQK